MKRQRIAVFLVLLSTAGLTVTVFLCRGALVLPSSTLASVTTDVHATASSSVNLRHGYVLTLRYSGQQGAGMRALISQQCWVGSFDLPMYVVEPFMHRNAIGSISTWGALKFSEYFDIDHYNKASIKDDYAKLATWEDFLENAPRRMILVQMDFQHKRDRTPMQLQVTFVANKTKKCYDQLVQNSVFQQLTRSSVYMHEFCIVKVIAVPFRFSSSKLFTAGEMHNTIFGKWNPEEVTLVFTKWRGPWCVPNPNLDNALFCKTSHVNGLRGRLYPSLQLLKHAENYENLFLKSRNSVAVMLRVEHVMRSMNLRILQRNLSIDECLQNVMNTTKRIQKTLSSNQAFVTADIGRYGSASWNLTLGPLYAASWNESESRALVKRTVCALSGKGWTFKQWEESFVQVTGGRDISSYIAALQRMIASRADCLVLVGGGSFQAIALYDYIRNHPDRSKWCIHLDCVVGKDLERFKDIMTMQTSILGHRA